MIGGFVGGVGVFLIGMLLLTDGLKGAAGDSLRSMLQRFARGPVSAIALGTAITFLIQSSSAAVVTTIGFVSAGLLTFSQAVAVIVGANLGTTGTAWLVAVLGFKLSLSVVALPIVGIGAFLRILGRGKIAHVGEAVAGFGLVFVGIDLLQAGMEGFGDRFDPAGIPSSTILGKVLLIGAGIVVTVIMQSSSAAVAATLAGVHAGALSLEQSLLLVIGQNIGTTATAGLAAIGAGVKVKRTALAHILFNVISAALVLPIFSPSLAGTEWVAERWGPAVAVALYHSLFAVFGIVIFFPFLDRYAAILERIVPERDPSPVADLDLSMAELPAIAIEAARRAGTGLVHLLFGSCVALLESDRNGRVVVPHEQARESISRMWDFVASIQATPSDPVNHEGHLALLHLVDHFDGFLRALDEFEAHARGRRRRELSEAWSLLHRALTPGDLPSGALPDAATVAVVSHELASFRKEHRLAILDAIARGEKEPAEAWREIDAIKLLDRMAFHAERMLHYLEALNGKPAPAAATV